MNYFISCKNDFIPGQETRWAHLHALVTTSEMASQVVAKDTGVKVDHCYELGFPRNDLLLHSEKTEAVRSWLVSKLGYMPKHIFLYAPTFRDYELDDKAFAKLFSSDPSWVDQMTFGDCRPLLGYEAEGLSEFLHQTRSVFIYHLHPMQKTAIIEKSDCMLAYEESYDYSLYDLMALSDCLITDYSSIGYDFLLRDRPLIYNLYDLELYARLRGLSYDPYEEYCAGHIVTNWQEMKKAMEDVVNGVDDYREKRDRVRSLMFKDPDDNATQRVVEWFDREIISH